MRPRACAVVTGTSKFVAFGRFENRRRAADRQSTGSKVRLWSGIVLPPVALDARGGPERFQTST